MCITVETFDVETYNVGVTLWNTFKISSLRFLEFLFNFFFTYAYLNIDFVQCLIVSYHNRLAAIYSII